MANLITGVIGVLMVVIFLGYYAVTLRSIPLWIIIVAILAMVVTDFYQSVKQKNDKIEN
ncbi:MAG: hypothetical protein ACE5KF_07705 [Kiloniellaceae bacterium]